MASRQPNPERITTALDAAGLDGPEVDRACGVEEPWPARKAVDLSYPGRILDSDRPE